MAEEPAEFLTGAEKTEEEKPFQLIRWDATSTVARLTMARPKHNVFNIQMFREMTRAIESLNIRDDVRLVVLDSAPECEGYFSAGVEAAGYKADTVFQVMDAFHGLLLAMVQISKPVMAVVDGVATGAGCELVAFCDMVIATENARFLQPEIKLGVFPPMGAVVYPRVIGPKRAMELLLTGDPLNAQQALMMGLVNRVVPKTALTETVDALVHRISEQSGPVLSLIKRVIFDGTWKPFEEALKNSQDIYLNQLFELEDSQEGLRAMVEKRKPVWKNK
ncbi:MAG: enoyl-CoA hydratase/isomerase family protein [Terriglobia bacterium]